MLRRECDLFTPRDVSEDDCEVGASCADVCACEAGPCTLYSEAHTPTPDVKANLCSQETRLCEHCGKHRAMMTRSSEGYGTEEECVLSDPQGESDADADIEDTDCRLHEPGSLQRISSRRRKRPQVARQDTTESEDDGGRSHRSHRWNLRLSPDRAHSRTILEESISQVRPLVICRPSVQPDSTAVKPPPRSKLKSLWPPLLPLALVLFLSLPLSLSLLILIVSFLLPWTTA